MLSDAVYFKEISLICNVELYNTLLALLYVILLVTVTVYDTKKHSEKQMFHLRPQMSSNPEIPDNVCFLCVNKRVKVK